VVHDPKQAKDSARVTVVLTDGRQLDRSVPHNLGTPGNPMSDDHLEDKMVSLSSPVLGEGAARRLADRCWAVTDLADLRPLLDCTVA
jgi:2-methylcitrate dehydratase PrpD